MHNLICLGLNHKTASIALRERFALSDDNLQSLSTLKQQGLLHEYLLVNTCNRFEIYVVADSVEPLHIWLADFTAMAIDELQAALYCLQNKAAITHLLKVACGLDSMVLGEPQILGQLKQAFAKAGEAESIGAQLGHLFPFAFNIAKKIRTDTNIGANPVSVAYAAINLAKRIFSNLQDANVLLIGAGETIQLAAQYLYDQPAKQIFVANRTVERAQQLAEKVNGQAIRIGDIPDHLMVADIIISSTASQLPILGKGLLERVVKQRKHNPLFIVDIAVPRDVEPEVADLEDVYLYNIDDLRAVVDANLQDRQLAAKQAKTMIAEEVEHFQHWQQSLDSVPAICAYRQQVELLRQKQLDKAKQSLHNGVEPEQVLEHLANELTKKLMHGPSVQMRQASYEGRNDLLEWAKRLLGINE